MPIHSYVTYVPAFGSSFAINEIVISCWYIINNLIQIYVIGITILESDNRLYQTKTDVEI